MSFGPMQLLVVGFGDVEATGEIAAELKRLREHDIVRLVDMIVVSRGDNGDVGAIEVSDLSKEQSEELGAIAGALIGLGAAGEEGAEAGALAGAEAADAGVSALGDEVWYVADAIPPGTTAAVAILEHRWAIGLRDAIAGRGGILLADAWLHPADLVALGAITAEEVAEVQASPA
jgi:uncharacterized membrane protein